MAPNLTDPSFEPTDEQLQRLSHEAFAEVAARNDQAMARLRAEISAMRAALLQRLAASRPR